MIQGSYQFLVEREKLLRELVNIGSFEEDQGELKPLEYFLNCSEDATVNDLNFDSFNTFDFRCIRRMLSIDDDLFISGFLDGFFRDPEEGAYDCQYDRNGCFKIECISPEDPFFLHRSVRSFKSYLGHNLSTSLAKYIGLFRSGSSYFAIEYLGSPKYADGCIKRSISWHFGVNETINKIAAQVTDKKFRKDLKFVKTLSKEVDVTFEITDR